MSVTWTRPEGTEACNISYDVYSFVELDTFTSVTLDTERFDVSDDSYCFRVYILIVTMFRGQIALIDDATYEEGKFYLVQQ